MVSFRCLLSFKIIIWMSLKSKRKRRKELFFFLFSFFWRSFVVCSPLIPSLSFACCRKSHVMMRNRKISFLRKIESSRETHWHRAVRIQSKFNGNVNFEFLRLCVEWKILFCWFWIFHVHRPQILLQSSRNFFDLLKFSTLFLRWDFVTLWAHQNISHHIYHKKSSNQLVYWFLSLETWVSLMWKFYEKNHDFPFSRNSHSIVLAMKLKNFFHFSLLLFWYCCVSQFYVLYR